MAEKSEPTKQPKRDALLTLKTSDKKLNELNVIKARAAQRTRQRIVMELQAKEMKRLELAMAKGEVSPEELEKLASKNG